MAQETITRHVGLAKGASDFFTFNAPSMPMSSYTWWMATCTAADKSQQQLREKTGAENRNWDTWYEGISDVNLNGTPRVWIKNNLTSWAEYDVSLILWYEETAHNITVTAGTGGSASVNFSTAKPGDNPTVTVTPSTGYSANTPTAPGITFTSAGTNKWTFTMPAQDVAISCTFTHVAYTISASAGSGGSASVNMATAYYGDNPTVTCTPNTGYKANSPTAPGITFTSAGTNKWTFSMPATNVIINCSFSRINYNVTVSAGTGGSASADKLSAGIGDTVTITCSPSTGYKANTPTCSGITFTSAGTNKWTFTMPANAVTISCTFSKINYTVTAGASPAAGGTLTSDKTTANYGDTVTLTRTAKTGYQFSSWTKTPSGLSIDSNLKFTMPAQNVSVTANFTKIDYAVTVNAGTGGSAAASKAPANYGDTITITCTPSAGYKANTPTASGITFTAAGTNKWTFTMPAKAVTVSCTFSKISYNVTISYGSNGSATLDKTTAQIGDTVTVTCSPNTGYKSNTPTATDITFTAAGTNKWTFTMPAKAVAVSCSFTKQSYTITAAASPTAGGTLKSDKTTAYYGDTVTLTRTEKSGYKFNRWTKTPSGLSIDGNLKFTMPAQNVSVTANFIKRDYTVTVNAGTGGTATGSVSTAQIGDTVTITCAASSGYTVNTPTASGITFTSAGTNKWSFTMPAANVTVSCTFSKISYNVTVTAGTGGSASSNKSTAGIGDTVTITCTPNTGYKANTPTATGITFTAAGTNKWTFTMKAAAVSISCSFSKVSYTITKKVSPSGAGTVTTGANSAYYGDQVTVSQTPASGYYFNGWTITPSSVTVSSGKITMPAQNVTIQANYLKRSTATVNTTDITGGGAVTLTINPDKTTYSHKYKLSFGTGMETSLTAVAAGTNTVVINVPDSWSTSIPSATSKTGGTLLVETYNGNTKIGTYTITGLTYNVPASSKPSIGTITTSIARTIGGTTYANVGDYYVQSKCGVRIQASGSGDLGSSVTKLEVTISGYTAAEYKKTVNAASVDFTSGLLTVSGTATITIKATDSRGRTNTKTKNISVTAYKKPSGTLNVYRVDANGDEDPLGTYAKYSLTKSYTTVGNNSLSWSLKSQNVTANSPAASGNILPSSRQTFAQLSEYNIELKLVDAFETVTIITKLPTAQFMIFVNGTGDRIAFMKATNESLSKLGKNGTIEFSENNQMYIGSQPAEDYFGGLTVVDGKVCVRYNT